MLNMENIKFNLNYFITRWLYFFFGVFKSKIKAFNFVTCGVAYRFGYFDEFFKQQNHYGRIGL